MGALDFSTQFVSALFSLRTRILARHAAHYFEGTGESQKEGSVQASAYTALLIEAIAFLHLFLAMRGRQRRKWDYKEELEDS